MKNQNITYVFEIGRKDRLADQNSSKEFYYGYHHFSKEFKSVNLIELKNINFKNNKFIYFFDKLLRKLTNLPFHFSRVNNKKIYKDFKNTDVIIFSTERSAMSSMLVVKKLKKKKNIKTLVIVMGLFVKPVNNFISKFLQKVSINFFLNIYENIVFLSRTEFEIAKAKYPKFNNKLFYLPFSVDTDFWKVDKEINFTKKDKIIFIGNDGRRNFNKVIEIAKKLPQYNFLFVTEKIDEEKIQSSNVTLIKGHWNLNLLSDNEIKKMYSQSRISLIPLINSLQPSGQSVAQQSMAMGVPVIISKTDGFWDYQKYQNNENIIFQDNEDVDSWIKTIEDLYDNQDKVSYISANGLDLIRETNNLDNFYKNLKKILALD